MHMYTQQQECMYTHAHFVKLLCSTNPFQVFMWTTKKAVNWPEEDDTTTAHVEHALTQFDCYQYSHE